MTSRSISNSQLAERIEVLTARLDLLVADNARLQAERSAEPPSEWVALKVANHGPYTYETVRSWCETGLILAEKRRGRWYVHRAGLSAHFAQLAAA